MLLTYIGLGIGALILFGIWGLTAQVKTLAKKELNYKVELQPYKTGDMTTVLPIPIAAATCTHDWQLTANHVLKVEHEQKAMVVMQCNLCGAIDKTVETTSKAPPPPQPLVPKSECRHKCGKVREVELSSAYEQAAALIKKAMEPRQNHSSYKSLGLDEITDVALPEPNTENAWAFSKTYISERICSECGEIDRLVASNLLNKKESNES